jgi:hypothetical protein
VGPTASHTSLDLRFLPDHPASRVQLKAAIRSAAALSVGRYGIMSSGRGREAPPCLLRDLISGEGIIMDGNVDGTSDRFERLQAPRLFSSAPQSRQLFHPPSKSPRSSARRADRFGE